MVVGAPLDVGPRTTVVAIGAVAEGEVSGPAEKRDGNEEGLWRVDDLFNEGEGHRACLVKGGSKEVKK